MELSKKCLEALRSGVSVQAEIRSILEMGDDEAAVAIIADQMGKFREAADTIIDSVPEGERKSTMKRVNNVINDVSRICREEMGYAIKLKSRKGGYVYNPVVWKAPEPKSDDSDTKGDAETIRRLTDQIGDLNEMVDNLKAENRTQATTLGDADLNINYMLGRWGKHRVAEALVKAIGEDKS